MFRRIAREIGPGNLCLALLVVGLGVIGFALLLWIVIR
jgi:hypothetical protein